MTNIGLRIDDGGNLSWSLQRTMDLTTRCLSSGDYTYVTYTTRETEDDPEIKSDKKYERVVLVGTNFGLTPHALQRIAIVTSELIDLLRLGVNASDSFGVNSRVDVRSNQPSALATLVVYGMERLVERREVSLLLQASEVIEGNGFTSSLDHLIEHAAGLLEDRDAPSPYYAMMIMGSKIVAQTSASFAERVLDTRDIGSAMIGEHERFLLVVLAAALFEGTRERPGRIAKAEKVLHPLRITREVVMWPAAAEAVADYARALDALGKPEDAATLRESFELLKVYQSEKVLPTSDMFKTTERDLCDGDEEHCSVLLNLPSTGTTGVLIQRISLRDKMVDCPSSIVIINLFATPERMTSVTQLGEEYTAEVAKVVRPHVSAFVSLQYVNMPVTPMSIPGLVHAVTVNRQQGVCRVGSFHHLTTTMREQTEASRLVMEVHLRAAVYENIARAIECTALGYSEGMWGHLGLQFFYCIALVPIVTAKQSVAPSAKKISPKIARDFLTQPMLLQPTLAGDETLLEVYALFAGPMTPAEAADAVEKNLDTLMNMGALRQNQ